MERNFYTDDFEQLLKEKADQFRMYPSKRVWHSIYNNLHPSRRWPSAVISILLFFSLVFTGYLNTNDPLTTNRFSGNQNNAIQPEPTQKSETPVISITNNKSPQSPNTGSGNVTGVQIAGGSENPAFDKNEDQTVFAVTPLKPENGKSPDGYRSPVNTGNDIIQSVDTYIKTKQLFSDINSLNKKVRIISSTPSNTETVEEEEFKDEYKIDLTRAGKVAANEKKNSSTAQQSAATDLLTAENKKQTTKIVNPADLKQITPEEKAWIENFAFQNKPGSNKWKNKLAIEFYVTPGVNYRELSANSKGSASLFATGDINRSISQKPGFGIETGLGLSYSFAKNLRLKGGLQFNYTNYNINADETNHPIQTTILMVDPITGYSYPASRTSSVFNAYNSSALQPVVLHNRTYQLSIPVGLAYKLSGSKNVSWFAGISVQPTYVFGGNAHIISSDLKTYVSEPSSIRSWNLNLGFETYMSYKLGAYNLQVGPQVRYQVNSTYRKNVALIEKPYAVGLKIGIVKGF